MLLDRLGRLQQRLPGMQALSLVDKDGIPVESVSMSPDLDLESLTAELIVQLQAMEHSLAELKPGQLDHLAVTTEDRILMVSCVTTGYYLLLVLTATANRGRARFELRRARLLLEDELL
ncbi:MAG TPA: roadblock/LC7 domain-containing protein [Thermoanaerobaculia bacterium]|nr:roadblock/LC7 domain-containing protein [Thermoanaerobaculia bacterium]